MRKILRQIADFFKNTPISALETFFGLKNSKNPDFDTYFTQKTHFRTDSVPATSSTVRIPMETVHFESHEHIIDVTRWDGVVSRLLGKENQKSSRHFG